jgi:hypothetical protein
VAQNYSQAYGYKFYFAPVITTEVDLTELDLGGVGSGKFLDDTSLLSNDAVISKSGTGATFKLFADKVTKTITKAAVATNVATLTFAAAHGFAQGAVIDVAGLPAPFAALNGVRTITGVTTTTPFTLTFAFTADNITEAVVAAGTASTGIIALDGTAKPIRLLGLTNAAPAETEGEETIITYDDEAKSFETSIATSKGFSWTVEGVTDHMDAAYQLLRICSKESVRERLMIKYARVGPTGFNEATYGYGRFTGFNETPPAGGIVKWSTNIKAYGPYELDLA